MRRVKRFLEREVTTNQDKVVGSPDQYVGWQTYLERHHSQGGEIFTSRHSLEWFCRQNTTLLIASGQYIPRRALQELCMGLAFRNCPPHSKKALHGQSASYDCTRSQDSSFRRWMWLRSQLGLGESLTENSPRAGNP